MKDESILRNVISAEGIQVLCSVLDCLYENSVRYAMLLILNTIQTSVGRILLKRNKTLNNRIKNRFKALLFSSACKSMSNLARLIIKR